MAANPRDSLCRDSKMDTYASRSFDLQKQWGRSVFEHGLALRLTCLSPTPTHINPWNLQQLGAAVAADSPLVDLFFFPHEKKVKETGNVFDETGDG